VHRARSDAGTPATTFQWPARAPRARRGNCRGHRIPRVLSGLIPGRNTNRDRRRSAPNNVMGMPVLRGVVALSRPFGGDHPSLRRPDHRLRARRQQGRARRHRAAARIGARGSTTANVPANVPARPQGETGMTEVHGTSESVLSDGGADVERSEETASVPQCRVPGWPRASSRGVGSRGSRRSRRRLVRRVRRAGRRIGRAAIRSSSLCGPGAWSWCSLVRSRHGPVVLVPGRAEKGA
jgi:hypothetical protein